MKREGKVTNSERSDKKLLRKNAINNKKQELEMKRYDSVETEEKHEERKVMQVARKRDENCEKKESE